MMLRQSRHYLNFIIIYIAEPLSYTIFMDEFISLKQISYNLPVMFSNQLISLIKLQCTLIFLCPERSSSILHPSQNSTYEPDPTEYVTHSCIFQLYPLARPLHRKPAYKLSLARSYYIHIKHSKVQNKTSSQ